MVITPKKRSSSRPRHGSNTAATLPSPATSGSMAIGTGSAPVTTGFPATGRRPTVMPGPERIAPRPATQRNKGMNTAGEAPISTNRGAGKTGRGNRRTTGAAASPPGANDRRSNHRTEHAMQSAGHHRERPRASAVPSCGKGRRRPPNTPARTPAPTATPLRAAPGMIRRHRGGPAKMTDAMPPEPTGGRIPASRNSPAAGRPTEAAAGATQGANQRGAAAAAAVSTSKLTPCAKGSAAE